MTLTAEYLPRSLMVGRSSAARKGIGMRKMNVLGREDGWMGWDGLWRWRRVGREGDMLAPLFFGVVINSFPSLADVMSIA